MYDAYFWNTKSFKESYGAGAGSITIGSVRIWEGRVYTEAESTLHWANGSVGEDYPNYAEKLEEIRYE